MDAHEGNHGPNHLLAALAIEELVRCGVKQFCISSGNWSTPLALAAARHPLVRAIVHYDERGAAFYALGWAKAHLRPAALICSSGTAVANYAPAVLEAAAGEVPLVVLTADRPEELQDAGANQTFDQVHFFRPHCRWEYSFAAPSAGFDQAAVLTAVDQAVHRAASAPCGPVHLNFRFRKPLLCEALPSLEHPTARLAAWRLESAPYTGYTDSLPTPAESDIRALARRLQQAKRGIMYVGALPPDADRKPIFDLAKALGWPVYADIASGMRFASRALDDASAVAAHAQLYLRSARARAVLAPDCVLQLGSETAKPDNYVLSACSEAGAERIFADTSPSRKDPFHSLSRRVTAEPSWLCMQLCRHVSASSSAAALGFAQAERIAREVLADFDGRPELSELSVARRLFQAAPAEHALYLAASLPVRLAEWAAPLRAAPLSVSANRGLSGIDGTLASAAGFAAAADQAVTVLCGDLAFLHDMNSLKLLADSSQPVVVVLLNNDGGGVFSLLPLSEFGEQYERYVGTPHGMEFEAAAQQFGLQYHQPAATDEFAEVYTQAAAGARSSVIEIKTSRRATKEELQAVLQTISERVEREL